MYCVRYENWSRIDSSLLGCSKGQHPNNSLTVVEWPEWPPTGAALAQLMADDVLRVGDVAHVPDDRLFGVQSMLEGKDLKLLELSDGSSDVRVPRQGLSSAVDDILQAVVTIYPFDREDANPYQATVPVRCLA